MLHTHVERKLDGGDVFLIVVEVEVIFGEFLENPLGQCDILVLIAQQFVAALSLAQIDATIARLCGVMSVNDCECFRFGQRIDAMIEGCVPNEYAGSMDLYGDANSGGVPNIQRCLHGSLIAAGRIDFDEPGAILWM